MFTAILSLLSLCSRGPAHVGTFHFVFIPLQVISKFPCDFSFGPLVLQCSTFPSVIEFQHHPAVVREYTFYGIWLLKSIDGNSLVVQRLGFWALAAEGLDSNPWLGIKISQAVQCLSAPKSMKAQLVTMCGLLKASHVCLRRMGVIRRVSWTHPLGLAHWSSVWLC